MENIETVTPETEKTGNNQVESLSLERLSELVGREVKDVEDFEKHYVNQKKYTSEVPEARKVISWLKDMNISLEDLGKINPFKAAEILKSIKTETEIAPTPISANSRKETMNELASNIKKTNSEKSKIELMKMAIGDGLLKE